ncbi:hypothetical protein HYY73_00295 [Candidatus Woesearchaeota archaeon]|nr:hypothetical protein [Candidatus Woesearchaeota archaeon]
MKARALLFGAMAAVVLAAAACSEGEKANIATSVPGVPYSCGRDERSNIAFLSPKSGDEAHPTTFDLSAFLAPNFHHLWRTCVEELRRR